VSFKENVKMKRLLVLVTLILLSPSLMSMSANDRFSGRGNDRTLAPRGNDSTLPPRGNNPTLAPRGNDPTLPPRSNNESLPPRGNDPTLPPRGNDPTLAPRGNESTPDEPEKIEDTEKGSPSEAEKPSGPTITNPSSMGY
jgi:hypothetical protein